MAINLFSTSTIQKDTRIPNNCTHFKSAILHWGNFREKAVQIPRNVKGTTSVQYIMDYISWLETAFDNRYISFSIQELKNALSVLIEKCRDKTQHSLLMWSLLSNTIK